MKILFLASKNFDYGQDLLHRGLVSLLGNQSVHAQPWNSKFYLPVKKYPKNLGCGDRASLLAYFRSLVITPKNADLIIVGSAKPDVFENYLSIIDQIPSSTPVAFIDGGDWQDMGGDLARLGGGELWEQVTKKRPFDFIFKREYMKNKTYPKNVFPFPFSMDPGALKAAAFQKPDKDVSFWAVESHPIRTQVLDLLTGQFDCDENGTGRNKKFSTYRYKGTRYHQELAKCKIVLSFRGAGWDTLRYWEVPALGPLLVSQNLDIVIPNDFEDGVHIAKCKDDLSDLIDICKYYLDNDSKRSAMTMAAYKHLVAHHTPLARARFLLERVQAK